MILSPFEYFVEKSREKVFQKILLSTTFLMPNLLKYSFFLLFSIVFYKNFVASYVLRFSP